MRNSYILRTQKRGRERRKKKRPQTIDFEPHPPVRLFTQKELKTHSNLVINCGIKFDRKGSDKKKKGFALKDFNLINFKAKASSRDSKTI